MKRWSRYSLLSGGPGTWRQLFRVWIVGLGFRVYRICSLLYGGLGVQYVQGLLKNHLGLRVQGLKEFRVFGFRV